jgi:HSP20 family molecular chaperone IbpA
MSRHASDPRTDAERTDAERVGEEFDELLRQSEQRAQEKRETHTYPYDLEESA